MDRMVENWRSALEASGVPAQDLGVLVSGSAYKNDSHTNEAG